jgi:glycosyltransferase involved in cell wall biosynthesis
MSHRITILIAHHNYERYLKKCLQSCVNQTYPCNICLVDDGTKNFEEVEKIANEFPITNFIRLKTPTGPSNARNVGIEATINNTDAYIILDADDYMYENKVETLVKNWEMATNIIGVVYADYHTENESSGNIIREFKEPYSLNGLRRDCIVNNSCLISKTALTTTMDEFGYYDVNMRTCEDFDLWLRIGEKFMIIHIPESLTRIKVHPNNSTETVDKEVWKQNWDRIAKKSQHRSQHREIQ